MEPELEARVERIGRPWMVGLNGLMKKLEVASRKIGPRTSLRLSIGERGKGRNCRERKCSTTAWRELEGKTHMAGGLGW